MTIESEERRRTPLTRSIVWIDHIWNFFASVKIAMVFIGLIALSAIAGTLIPQENAISSVDPASYYTSKFGSFGTFMFRMGLTRMYTSWWFITLLLLLAMSLIICSWERIVPLYRSLTRQTVKKSVAWIRQRSVYTSVETTDAESLDRLESTLRRRRYRVTKQDGALLAEKGRLSRYGPYIIHIGLLIVIAAAFVRLLPGWFFNKDIIVDNGQTVAVPNTSFSIRNDQFTMQQYPDGRAKMYETKASVLDQGKSVLHQSITVNHPLEYQHVLFFQESFTQPRFQSATVAVSDRKGNPVGQVTLNLSNLSSDYQVGPYTVHISNYFPDFSFDGSEPVTVSSEPNKPVFIMTVKGPGIAHPQPQWFVLFMPIMSGMLSKDAPFQFMVNAVHLTQSTVLRVHKDLSVPYIYFGSVVVLFGLAVTFYIQHRRMWVRLDDTALHVGAHTNKNIFALKRDFQSVVEASGLIQGDGTTEVRGIDHAGRQ